MEETKKPMEGGAHTNQTSPGAAPAAKTEEKK